MRSIMQIIISYLTVAIISGVHCSRQTEPSHEVVDSKQSAAQPPKKKPRTDPMKAYQQQRPLRQITSKQKPQLSTLQSNQDMINMFEVINGNGRFYANPQLNSQKHPIFLTFNAEGTMPTLKKDGESKYQGFISKSVYKPNIVYIDLMYPKEMTYQCENNGIKGKKGKAAGYHCYDAEDSNRTTVASIVQQGEGEWNYLPGKLPSNGHSARLIFDMLVNSFIYLRDADQFTKVYHEFSEMAAQVDKEDSIAKGPGLEELAKTAAMKKSSDHARSSGSKTSTAIGGDLKAKPKENGINRGERTSLMSDNDDLQKNDGDKSDHHRKSQKFDQESSESEDNSPSKQSQSPRKQSSPFTSTPFEDDDNDMQSFPKSRSFNSEPRSPHGPRDFEQDFDGDDGDLNNDFPPAVGGRKRNTYDDRDNIETNDDD